MSSPPRISVAMPVYNAQRYLSKAVESILHQTFGDFEFIIINDGSTDQSLAILEKYAADDPRIRLFSRANTGYSRALSEALACARGEYFARMDADDISLPQRFEKQVAYLDAHPDCLAVGCRVLLIDSDGDPIAEMHPFESHERIDQLHLEGGCGAVITHPSAMFRTSALRELGGYRVDREPAEDLDLFLRLAERGRLAKLPDLLFHYRVHLQSVGHSRRVEQLKAIRRVASEARTRRGLPPLPEESLKNEPRGVHVASQHMDLASMALRYGNRGSAWKHIGKALRRSPLSVRGWYLVVRGMLPSGRASSRAKNS